MEHLQDTSTYMEADVENLHKRVLEIVTEHADDKGHFSLGRIFYEERHFLLFNDQLAQSGRQTTKENIIPRGKFRLVEDSPNTPSILTAKENEYISDFVPSSSKIHCLPIIHKNEEIKRIMEKKPTRYLKMPEPLSIPGRPIVGGPNCPTHKLSNC